MSLNAAFACWIVVCQYATGINQYLKTIQSEPTRMDTPQNFSMFRKGKPTLRLFQINETNLMSGEKFT